MGATFGFFALHPMTWDRPRPDREVALIPSCAHHFGNALCQEGKQQMRALHPSRCLRLVTGRKNYADAVTIDNSRIVLARAAFAAARRGQRITLNQTLFDRVI